jgi:uncharacterized membrane protein
VASVAAVSEARRATPSLETLASRLSTARVEAFSDGVFAIAITLLALDIGLSADAGDDLLQALLDEWPAYISYLTSFAVIGVGWLLHHWIVGSLRLVDLELLRLNLLLLLFVAFLPFPTMLMGTYLGEGGNDPERVAVIFYGICILLTKGALGAMWRYAARHPALLKEDVSSTEITAVGRLVTPDVISVGVVTLIAIVAPRVAAGLYCAIAIASLAWSR